MEQTTASTMKDKPMEILATRNYKAGYYVQREKHYVGTDNDEVIIRVAYTPDGDYIGDVKTARYLILKRNIKPEFIDNTHNICQVGWCKNDQKWYGWSHRAICGFGMGDKLFEEEFAGGESDTPFVEHGTVTIENLEQMRAAAANFALSVA